MSRHNSYDSRIYVGNLPRDVRKRELEDLFEKYGYIRRVDLKADNSRKAPFCFIEYEERRDAKRAIRHRDGYEFGGFRMRVEFCKGVPYSDRRYDDDRRDRPRRESTGFRLLLSNLPKSASWQDVKDHFRPAGKISFADVYKDGTGIIEFSYKDSMERAYDDFNGTELHSRSGEVETIQIKKDAEKERGGDRSDDSVDGKRAGSRKRRRDESGSESPKRRRNRSRSSDDEEEDDEKDKNRRDDESEEEKDGSRREESSRGERSSKGEGRKDDGRSASEDN